MWLLWEKKPLQKKHSKFLTCFRHYASLSGVDHCSELQDLGLAFKRDCSIYMMQSSKNAQFTVLVLIYKGIISDLYPNSYSTVVTPL